MATPQNNNITTAEQMRGLLRVLPNPSDVLKQKSTTVKLYHRVLSHPDVFSVSQNYKDAICAMNRSCTDEWMQRYMDYFRSTIKQFIRDVTSARDYGFIVIEVIEYDTFEGKTVPTKFQLCPPEMFVIGQDMELRMLTRDAAVEGIDVMKMHPNKFIWVKNEASLIRPYGLSLLDTVYWIAVGLNGNFDAMLNFAEYDGADKWIGKHAPDATEDERYYLLEQTVKLKANSVTVIPEGQSIELIENKGRGSTGALYKDINEMLIRKVEKLWFGTDLTMQVDGKGGYSSSKTGLDIREDALQLGADLVAEGLSQVYNIIAAVNQMSVKEVSFDLNSPRKISKEEAEVDKIYFEMGLKPNAKFFENRGYTPEEIEQIQTTGTEPQNKPSGGQFSADGLDTIFDIFKDTLPK